MRSSKSPPLDSAEAFVHVVNEHRWLAVSACCWNLVGPKASHVTKSEAHLLLPNVDVIALDSLLLHARALIDFYTKTSSSPTDILLKNFDRIIDAPLKGQLNDYKRPIEVHLLHLTNWRDRSYRLSYSVDFSTHRRDWNHEAIKLVALLHKTIRSAARLAGVWQMPFGELHKASVQRYRDKSFAWPKHLGEQADIFRYLDSLGI